MTNQPDLTKYDPLPPGVNPLEYYKLGTVIPSRHDERDFTPAAHLTAPESVELPDEFELPDEDAHNQLDVGACGAFGVGELTEWELRKLGMTLDFSEWYQYALTRELMGTGCEDSGSEPRKALDALITYGAVPENVTPYKSQSLCWRPDERTKEIGVGLMAPYGLEYFRSLEGTNDSIKRMLYGSNGKDGHKVACCYLVFENFNVGMDGLHPWPQGRVMGGHWVTYTGWSNRLEQWKKLNQWSRAWGDRGYFYTPYQIDDLSWEQGGVWRGDLWAVRAKAAPLPEPPERTPLERVQEYLGHLIGGKWARSHTKKAAAREISRDMPSVLGVMA